MVGEVAKGTKDQHMFSEFRWHEVGCRGSLRRSVSHVRGEACAGPGKETERCICIMAPSGLRLTAISSSDSFEMPVSKQQKGRTRG